MIYKSYIVEENFDVIKNNISLFYGENLGLIQEFKKQIFSKYTNDLVLKFTQEEILKNYSSFLNELENTSLFNNKKIFIINDVNDKGLEIIEEILLKTQENKFFIFANLLEKKSKLRSFFEKNELTNIIPCYQDNEISIKKIITKKLKNYIGLSPTVINAIAENCSNDRTKLNNEIEKIKVFFEKKSIDYEKLIKLINQKEDDDFNYIKDNALFGSKLITNKLLNSMHFEDEKTTLYLASINQRFYRIKEILQSKKSIEVATNNLKPPIFWKDKPGFLRQCKIWNIKKIDKALSKTYKTEVMIKSNSNINKNIIVKKLIVDICNLANVA